MKSNESKTARTVAGPFSDAPKSLADLGVNRTLAAEFEVMFRAMGKTEGEEIVGFTFTTKDGVRHPLKLASAGPRRKTESLEHAA
jgi:hypothetical protein